MAESGFCPGIPVARDVAKEAELDSEGELVDYAMAVVEDGGEFTLMSLCRVVIKSACRKPHWLSGNSVYFVGYVVLSQGSTGGHL